VIMSMMALRQAKMVHEWRHLRGGGLVTPTFYKNKILST
jgi:hypothetical protein